MYKNLEALPFNDRTLLLEIYREFSSKCGFPKNQCQQVADAVHSSLGYPVYIGSFHLDYPKYHPDYQCHSLTASHAFSLGPEDYIIDLTARQFNRYLQHPLPCGILVIPPNTPLYLRYSITHNS